MSTPMNCHNCGNALPVGAQYCPQCAAKVGTGRSQKFFVLRVLGAVFLCFVALGLGALGACLMLIVAASGSSAARMDGGLVAWTAVVSVLFIGCVFGIFKLLK